MTKALAALTLISWLVVFVALAGGKGTTKGAHVGACAFLSIALAIAVAIS